MVYDKYLVKNITNRSGIYKNYARINIMTYEIFY